MAQDTFVTFVCDEQDCTSRMTLAVDHSGIKPTPEQQFDLLSWLDVSGNLMEGKKNYCSAICALKGVQRLFDESLEREKQTAKQSVEDNADLNKVDALANNKEKIN